MLMLTDYLIVGGRLVAGDKCYNPKTDESNVFDRVISDGEACAGMHDFSGDGCGIYDNEDLKDLAIESFSLRDNNGKQPVPDDFPVVVEFRCGDKKTSEASSFTWSLYSGDYEIKSWAPDYGKLLEQQNEYDKQQEKPIEEIMINAKESKMSEFTYGQKIYIKNHDKRDFKFACYHIDGDSILFMFDDGYGHVGIDNVSATPFKDELEIAQEEQVEILVGKWSHWFSSTEKAADFFKVLQGSGDLSEIILPPED